MYTLNSFLLRDCYVLGTVMVKTIILDHILGSVYPTHMG